MPRAKRILHEADPNATIAPPSKRMSTGKTSNLAPMGRENFTTTCEKISAGYRVSKNYAPLVAPSDDDSSDEDSSDEEISEEDKKFYLTRMRHYRPYKVADLKKILKGRKIHFTSNMKRFDLMMELTMADEEEVQSGKSIEAIETQNATFTTPSTAKDAASGDNENTALPSERTSIGNDAESAEEAAKAEYRRITAKDCEALLVRDLKATLEHRKVPFNTRMKKPELAALLAISFNEEADGKKGKSVEPAKTAAAKTPTASSLEWLCHARPLWDRMAEIGYQDEDVQKEEYRKAQEEAADNDHFANNLRVNLVTGETEGASADDHPDWPWIQTRRGAFLVNAWFQEMQKRDQDNFAMHIFEDWNGYGTIEIIQNATIEFDKDLKKNPTADALWPHIEGLAWFFHDGMDQMHFYMLADGGDKFALISLLGVALLTTIDVLIAEGKFVTRRPDQETGTAPIRNLGLILSLWIMFADGQSCADANGESDWASTVVKRAEQHEVEIKGLFGIEDTIQNLRKKSSKRFAKYNWKSRFPAYRSRYQYSVPMGYPIGVGGSKFDITKMSKEEKAKHSYGSGPEIDSAVGSDDEVIMVPRCPV